MMRQDFNLYRKLVVSQPTTGTLTWRQFWLANLFFCVLLSLVHVCVQWDVYSLIHENDELTLQIQTAENEFNVLKSQYPKILFSENLTTSLKELQNALEIQKRILTSITDRVSFSANLLAFAQSITPNVWLTGFILNDGGNEITLKGKSIDNQSMQKFIST